MLILIGGTKSEAVNARPTCLQGGTASVQLLVRRNLGPPPALDVYYLMDASASMLPHFRAAKDLGSLLARVLGDAVPGTGPHRADHVLHLGFGAFADKPAIRRWGGGDLHLCVRTRRVVGLACLPPFSFWHALPLGGVAVADAETVPPVPEFILRVQGQRISANLDGPEGGLDAILQAAVCKEQLGWRPGALHVLLVASDADLHLPLDARLAGVVRPHDGRCHLSGRSVYTRAADMVLTGGGQGAQRWLRRTPLLRDREREGEGQ
uniref:Integrin beta-6-like n=1 Tax=Petromyzon marinus TaxID=7757 RepID=A0AAJ7TXI8_PETMA|nr:integrin beta-6-like [Petromyzon marinus]